MHLLSTQKYTSNLGDKSRNNQLQTKNQVSGETASFGHPTQQTQKSAFSSQSTMLNISRGVTQIGQDPLIVESQRLAQTQHRNNTFKNSNSPENEENRPSIPGELQNAFGHYLSIPGLSQKYNPPNVQSARVSKFQQLSQSPKLNISRRDSMSSSPNNQSGKPSHSPLPKKSSVTQYLRQNDSTFQNQTSISSVQSISPKSSNNKDVNHSSQYSGMVKNNRTLTQFSTVPSGLKGNIKQSANYSYNTQIKKNQTQKQMAGSQHKSSFTSSNKQQDNSQKTTHLNHAMMQKRTIIPNKGHVLKIPNKKTIIQPVKQTLSMKHIAAANQANKNNKLRNQSKNTGQKITKGIKTTSINIAENNSSYSRNKNDASQITHGNSISSNNISNFSSRGQLKRKDSHDKSSSCSSNVKTGQQKKVIKQKLLFDPNMQFQPQNHMQNQHMLECSRDSASPPSTKNENYNLQTTVGISNNQNTYQNINNVPNRMSYNSSQTAGSVGGFNYTNNQYLGKTEVNFQSPSKINKQFQNPISQYGQMTQQLPSQGKMSISSSSKLPQQARKNSKIRLSNVKSNNSVKKSNKTSESSLMRKGKKIIPQTIDLNSAKSSSSKGRQSNPFLNTSNKDQNPNDREKQTQVPPLNMSNNPIKRVDSSNLRYMNHSPQNRDQKYQPYNLDQDEKIEEMKSGDPAVQAFNGSPYHKNYDERTEKKERSIYDESCGFSSVQKSNPSSPSKVTNFPLSSQKKKKNEQEVLDPTVRCSQAIKLIEEIENISKKDEEEFNCIKKLKTSKKKVKDRDSDSEDSNDSLIQTQRKLKKEYEEIRQSQKENSWNKNQRLSTKEQTGGESPVRQKKNNQMNKISSQSTNKRIYVKQTNINLSDNNNVVETHKQQKREIMTEDGSMKFPMGQFLSASSDFEENLVIERFSMQLHSQSQEVIQNGSLKKNFVKIQKEKNNLTKFPTNKDVQFSKKIQPAQIDDFEPIKLRQVITESQAVQNTINSLQSLNSLKQYPNDSLSTKDQLKYHEKKPSEYSQLEKISSIQKKSVIQTNESEKCPFKTNNRSPDSFVRISVNGKDEMQPNITRVSLLSMVQNSESKTSHISQKSSIVQTDGSKTPEQISSNNPKTMQKDLNDQIIFEQSLSQTKSQPTGSFEQRLKQLSNPQSQNKSVKSQNSTQSSKQVTTRKSNNIEINIEKILQIIQLLEGIIESQQNLILVNDARDTYKQNKDFQAKFERINEERLHSTVNLCEEWWNVIREATVSQQLNKSIKILSHSKIQNGLRKSMIYQLLFFSMTGYLYSQQQYHFAEILTELAYYSHLNFSVMCQILVEKFPEEIIKKNAWANKLQSQLLKNKKMASQLSKIQENISLNQNNSNSVNHSIEFPDHKSMASGLSSVSQNTLLNREVKHQYLKINNKMCHDLFSKLISISENETDYDDCFHNCLLMNQLKSVLRQIESPETLLMETIDKIGRALREDYNVDCVQNLPDHNDIKKIQEQISNNLRVQIDNGLKLVPAPYLPKQTIKEYTLVLDLDETLLHFEELNDNEGQLSIRPGADSFLKLMSEYFYIVIFTAGTEEYADWALSFLENEKLINFRLYRQHALPFNNFYVKDISRLGSDLSKTLIVDNIAENFQLQPYNGIFIKTWIDAADDVCLFTLAPFLIQIVTKKVPDVREYMKQMHLKQERVLDEVAYGPQSKKNQEEIKSLEQMNDDQKMNAIDELTSEDENSSSYQEMSAAAKMRQEIGKMSNYVPSDLEKIENDIVPYAKSNFPQSEQKQIHDYGYSQEQYSPRQKNSFMSQQINQQLRPQTIYTIPESYNENGSSMELSPNPTQKLLHASNFRTSFKMKDSEILRRNQDSFKY